MNCNMCGKSLVAGYVLCSDCSKNLSVVPGLPTRLGYYVQHPEDLARLLAVGSCSDMVCKYKQKCENLYNAGNVAEIDDSWCVEGALEYLLGPASDLMEGQNGN